MSYIPSVWIWLGIIACITLSALFAGLNLAVFFSLSNCVCNSRQTAETRMRRASLIYGKIRIKYSLPLSGATSALTYFLHCYATRFSQDLVRSSSQPL